MSKLELIKVNLPSDLESFKTGNGEGIWARPLSEEDERKVNDDNYYGEAYVVAQNDSVYYPGLINYDDTIKVHCNGKMRPYLHIDLFNEYGKKTNPEKNKEEIMKKIGGR